MPAGILVAVASKDRRAIDLHFGHADAFAIYALSDAGVEFKEMREAACYCHEDSDAARRNAVMTLLADCKAVFAARMGDTPKERLRQAGIAAVTDYPFEPIGASLLAWWAARLGK